MRVGFLLKHGKPEARPIAHELAVAARSRGCAVVFTDEDADVHPEARRVAKADLASAIDILVVLGGDGTFLYAAALVADAGVPLFGVNLGSLGFMTHFALGEVPASLLEAIDGRLPIDERMRLSVTVRQGDRVVGQRRAVNDAVISQAAIARLLDLEARLDGDLITTYKGDGLILSTPTGSTAYNLAAGGPVLTPDLEAIVVTPICPHTLTNRPIVLRADRSVSVVNRSTTVAQLTVDGQWGRPLAPGESIEVRKADQPLRILRGATPFFGILQQKLSWGERQG